MKKIPLSKYALLEKSKQMPYDFLISNTKGGTTIEILSCGKWVQLKPKHTDIWEYNWSEVISLKTAIQEQSIQDIAKVVYGISDLQRVNVVDVFTSFGWVTDAVGEMAKIEARELNHTPTGEEENAGINEMKKFGEQGAILSVMETLRLTEEEVLKLPYHKAFMILCYNKTLADINRKMIKNVS